MATVANDLLQQYTTFPIPVECVDARDANTADSLVKRDCSMLRLTGRHPFNAEAPLKALESAGFVTPNQLHFVRNHGPVPQLSWDDHRVEISGLVNRPVSISMRDIFSMPPTTLPITMACAGNRRKEQNVHKQSIGFAWGAGALSTACWTGVFLRDVLENFAGGLKSECNFICFDGSDKTAKGPYGTSLPANRVMSDQYDVMLAYKMNGEVLPPDHGFPIRVIIPGCIGGRSVKWLARIEASENDSTNVFHLEDNKVFPTSLRSAEQATEEGWWQRPEYILYDLNINSAITTPGHCERIEPKSLQDTYVLRGYAYSGGNRRITRVEVSLDSGNSWNLADPERVPAERLASMYGELVGTPYYKRSRNWTWVRWSLGVSISELLEAKELVVRAWDESQNTQPPHLTWNLMGMMNNCWFRVKLSHERQSDLPTIFCEHPTTVAPTEASGWLEKEKALEAAVAKVVQEKPKADLKTYTMAQVEKHAFENDCWIVVHGLVYDCTRFLKDHPGGVQSIMIAAATDCSEEFDAIHSEKAQNMLSDYLIGEVPGGSSTASDDNTRVAEPSMEEWSMSSASSGASSPRSFTTALEEASPFLDQRQWKKITLESKKSLSASIRLLRFTFDSSMVFGLPVGKHVYLKLPQEKLYKDMSVRSLMRAYTPSNSGPGFVEFIVKIYFPESGSHSIGGAFTQRLDKVRIGETVDTKGPLGEYEYLGDCQYSIMHEPNRKARHIGMIAGGTGITPMWQILCALQYDQDLPFVSLIYCARYRADLVLAEEINEMQAQIPHRLRVRYILSKPPAADEWDGGRGRLNAGEVFENLFPFADTGAQVGDKVVLLCASDDMIAKCCKPLISEVLGAEFMLDNVFVF